MDDKKLIDAQEFWTAISDKALGSVEALKKIRIKVNEEKMKRDIEPIDKHTNK